MERLSDKPFGDALRALMSEFGLSYRSLAVRTRLLDGKGMTHAHINMLANGHDKPSMRAIALIAQACEVRPDYFAQYRLAAAMRELDPAESHMGKSAVAERTHRSRTGESQAGKRRRPSG